MRSYPSIESSLLDGGIAFNGVNEGGFAPESEERVKIVFPH